LRTAFFTGAGASRSIGYPLTSEFLPTVRRLLRSGQLFKEINSDAIAKADRAALREYLAVLLPGMPRTSDASLPLITDIFSLLDHSLGQADALPIGGQSEIRHCRQLLMQAITDVLISAHHEEFAPAEAKTHSILVNWLHAMSPDLGFITTNYDTSIETELYGKYDGKKLYDALDLGYDWRDLAGNLHSRPVAPALRVYKLHGSFDLLRCATCGFVYLNRWGNIAHQAFRRRIDSQNTCHCRSDQRLELHIVSPSHVRDVRDSSLLNAWRHALEWMRTSDRWIIAGYSLPSEDLAIRSLLLKAYHTAPKKPTIHVVQRGDGAKNRYKVLFPKCRYYTGGLNAYVRANAEKR
jgi:NAD-dependent SIR2 family protein deacetylase